MPKSKTPRLSLDLPDDSDALHVAKALAEQSAATHGKPAAVVVTDEDGNEVCRVNAIVTRH